MSTEYSSLYAALLTAPCVWPRCSCSRKYESLRATAAHWNATGAEPPQLELDAALVEGQLVLACMSHRCRDKSVRFAALMELLNHVFKHVPEAEARLIAASSCDFAEVVTAVLALAVEDACGGTAAPVKSACGAEDDIPVTPSLLGRWPITPEGRRATAIAEVRKGFRVVAGAKRSGNVSAD